MDQILDPSGSRHAMQTCRNTGCDQCGGTQRFRLRLFDVLGSPEGKLFFHSAQVLSCSHCRTCCSSHRCNSTFCHQITSQPTACSNARLAAADTHMFSLLAWAIGASVKWYCIGKPIQLKPIQDTYPACARPSSCIMESTLTTLLLRPIWCALPTTASFSTAVQNVSA